jgi:hypothetical protein
MSSDSTRQCLNFEERPITPPHVKKYRRSTYLEPGKRFMHHGIVEDVNNLHLDTKIFGVTDSKFRDGAADLIRPNPLTETARLNILKAEKVYKRTNREPLGHSPERNIHIPNKFGHGKHFFFQNFLFFFFFFLICCIFSSFFSSYYFSSLIKKKNNNDNINRTTIIWYEN